jgi:hypothetical protein
MPGPHILTSARSDRFAGFAEQGVDLSLDQRPRTLDRAVHSRTPFSRAVDDLKLRAAVRKQVIHSSFRARSIG